MWIRREIIRGSLAGTGVACRYLGPTNTYDWIAQPPDQMEDGAFVPLRNFLGLCCGLQTSGWVMDGADHHYREVVRG